MPNNLQCQLAIAEEIFDVLKNLLLLTGVLPVR